MKKVLIVTAIWNRHDLDEIILQHYNQFKCNGRHDIQLLAVGSEGEKSERLCKSNGWNYVEWPNEAVSQKFNYLFQASRQYNYDLLILVGSDDLLSEEIITFWENNVHKNVNEIYGLRDLYFFNLQTNETLYFNGYPPPSPRTIGAGRCFTRQIMERINFRPWHDFQLNQGLDTACTHYLKKFGIGERAFSMAETGGICVDVKHYAQNITAFHRLYDYGKFVGNDIIDDYFKPAIDRCRALRKCFNFNPEKNYRVKIIKQYHCSRPVENYGHEIVVSGTLAEEMAVFAMINPNEAKEVTA